MRNNILWKTSIMTSVLVIILIAGSLFSFADGGMYPVNQLNKDQLKNAGLKINPNEIYNPEGISLLHAIVNLGGCTGSFVSSEGLILTNHHCVFGSLKTLSTTENNLMEKGFLAATKDLELPMKDATVKIMLNYEDVTKDVLKGITPEINPITRREIINKNIEQLVKKEKEIDPELSIEVSEMMTGKSYILFRYQFLKDIRIVYVPQREIGEFGGETDNWMWPRHNGDFAFARAYVGKDGKSATYSTDNVPFKPEKYLKVNSSGVSEDDFVFILGYPGRTYRNRPAEFIRYMEEVYMPFIAEYFEYRINALNTLSEMNPSLKVSYDPLAKSLANTSKNFRGKLKSLERIDLYETKKTEEKMILELLKDNPGKAKEYSNVLKSLDSLYSIAIRIGPQSVWFDQLFRSCQFMALAQAMVTFADKSAGMDPKSKEYADYFSKTLTQLKPIAKSTDIRLDSIYLKKLLLMAMGFNSPVEGLKSYNSIAAIEKFIREAYSLSSFDENMLAKLLSKPGNIYKSKNLFIRLYLAIKSEYIENYRNQSIVFNSIDALLPIYVELKMDASGGTFMPDANSTFRLTYGYIRGYYPADGIYASPFTTLKGIPEKISLGGDYKELKELTTEIDNARVERYLDARLKAVPVNFLYNADTTGGNSGSPVLNAWGELVGLNFDRTYEATINDFAWDESYSRSIGVDIRYILFITREIGKASHLLSEMDVPVQ